MNDKLDPATVLEEAADLLLIRGVCRDGSFGQDDGPRCAYGAIGEAMGIHLNRSGYWSFDGQPTDVDRVIDSAAGQALHDHIEAATHWFAVPVWNDNSPDDFEVIDTLRLVAKDIRNEAKS